MLWLGALFWALGIVGSYVILKRRYKSLASQLSDDPKERAEQFWQWLAKQRWRLGIILAPPITLTAFGLVIVFYNLDAIWFYRLQIPAFAVTLFAFILARLLAHFEFDRFFRGSSWSFGTFLRFWVAWNCWMNGMLISWLIGLEVLRQFAISFPTEEPQPFWTVTILVYGFGLPYILLLNLLPRLLLRWERVQDEKLLSALRELTEKSGLKPMKLWKLNIPGGLVPLGLSMPKTIVISDFICEQLNLDEMKALFAHELAHLKLGHLWKRHFILLGFLALEIALLASLPLKVISYGHSVAIGWLALWFFTRLMLPAWRRHELQADRWAVELVGDRELVAQMLEKIHTLSFMPAAFPKGVKVTHPSLLQRLEILRGQT